MRVNWVLADDIVMDPKINLTKLKDIGSFWGSWRTWRTCSTDNVVCHDLAKAQELLKRDFHTLCNLYLPNSFYVPLNRPDGIKLYEGELNVDVDNRDELVALTLASTVSDIVLLLGFDWSQKEKSEDKLQNHRDYNYQNIILQIIQNNQEIQWVMVDPMSKVRKEIAELANFSTDSLESVLKLLND